MAIDEKTINNTSNQESFISHYHDMGDDELHDEENIEWHVLVLRIFALIALALLIVFIALGSIVDDTYWYLSVLLTIGLLTFLVLSFFKFDCAKSTFILRHSRSKSTDRLRHGLNDSSNSSSGGSNL